MLRTACRMLASTAVLAALTAGGGGGTSKSNGAASPKPSAGTAYAPPTPLQVVRDAIAATRAAQSAKYEGTFALDAGPISQNHPATGLVALNSGESVYTVNMADSL